MIEKVDPLSVVGVCVLAVRGCASARGRLPHVARRIACLWLRFTVGVGIVFVESLRLFQSFDIVCPQREVGHCRVFSWL